MATPYKKYVDGFRLLNELIKKRKYMNTTGVVYALGDALILTSGYLALATTLQQTTPVFVGICNQGTTEAEATAAGTGGLWIEVIPPDYNYDFMVPAEATAVLAQTDVGTLKDLETEDGIDEGDTVTAGKGFYVDAIDISTSAVAIHTYGFAIGHFEDIFAS